MSPQKFILVLFIALFSIPATVNLLPHLVSIRTVGFVFPPDDM